MNGPPGSMGRLAATVKEIEVVVEPRSALALGGLNLSQRVGVRGIDHELPVDDHFAVPR
jgi:hypothetical protein